MTAATHRQQLLRSLVELERPLAEIVHELSRLGWDSDRDLVTLERRHVLRILERFREGELPAEQVEAWANAVEAREDIAFERGEGNRPAADLLAECRAAMGEVFYGWKGGEFVMGALTPVWLAHRGDVGLKLMALRAGGEVETADEDEMK